MIQLKTTFNKKGTIFNQIYKDNELAIYQLTKQCANDKNCIITWYEIFKIKIHKQDKYHTDEYEMYPYDEAFGTFAWSCQNLESLNKILKREFPNHKVDVNTLKFTG